jgi:hypothetical protein
MEDSQVRLIFANQESILAQQVFLALGPIGSAAVLIKSGFEESFQMRDTHTVQSALISFRRITEKVQQNALSKIWIKSENFQGDVYIQMHLRSELHLERLMDKLPNLFRFRWIAKLLSKCIYPILIYFDQELSGKILIELENKHGSESRLFHKLWASLLSRKRKLLNNQ